MPTSSPDGRDWMAEVGDADTVQAAFDEMPVMMLASSGPEHRIVAANAAYRATSGRPLLVGRTLAEAFPEIGGEQIRQMYDLAFRTGLAQEAREWHVPAEAAGRGTPADRYFDFTVTPRGGPDGTVAGLLLVAVDATSRVRDRQAALDRAETAEQSLAAARETVAALQRELLPAGLPVLARVRLAAAYLPAEADAAAGGDWFDAVALADGRVAMSVGDVVGHGVAASASMGQMRAVLQDRLLETGDIAAGLAALDRLAHRLPGARASTVCAVLLDPASGELTYCTAGHPPPLLIDGDGVGRYLPPTGAGPLGDAGAFPTGVARLAEGELIVLISDGLIERPGRAHAASLAEIAQVTADAAADRVLRGSGLSAVQRTCRQTLEVLMRASGHADDVTILAAQRVAAPVGLRLKLSTGPGVVTAAHRAVGEWLRAAGVGRPDVSALRHAVGELVTNSAEHAYDDGAGPVRVTGDFAPDGTVRIEVGDEGRWRERPLAVGSRAGGLGLVLAGQLVDALRVRPSGTGTTVEIRHAVHTPPMATAGVGAVPAEPDDPDLLLVLAQDHEARVDGAVTVHTAGQLARELRRLTANGTRSLTVDLTGVTVLSSAGVAVLMEMRRTARAHDTTLVLRAEPGSAAHHVLAVTRLTAEPLPES
jgi:serine phosphatase RsbU (regulator of sigma subunit)/anti-sigma regulatory factor (Ser/Thr protein kinase)/anti-anti-sigma regulatory factor